MYLPSNSIGENDGDQLFPIDDIRQLSEDISTSSFSQTRAGWVIPTVTSIISFFASALIIYIIARSDRNRYTATYHRIMVFMSIADMLSSSAISLTTIPMPQDVNEVYSFDGNSYGTVVTCEIQAFTYVLGISLSAGASLCLSVYYLLTIRYHVSHQVITRCVEPTFFIMTLLMGAIPQIFTTLRRQLYNPNPLMSWCVVSEFPQGCSDDGVGCIRGQEGAAKARTIVWFQVAALTILQVVCLGSIVATVYTRHKEQAQTELFNIYGSNQLVPKYEEDLQPASIEEVSWRDEGEVQYQEVEKESDAPLQHNNGANSIQDTRMIVKHAIMYAVAFVGTNFFPILSPDSTILAILTITFRPLQGFFNALIFISQKVYIIRQADEDLTFYKALNRIIMSPSVVPAIVLELPKRLTTLRNGSASSSCLSFPTRGKSSIGPSLVISNSGGSKELPTDREPALKRYYDGVHIPSSDMPAPSWLPVVTQDAIGCTIRNESHAKRRGSYLSDFSYLDTINEEIIGTIKDRNAASTQ
eukprot:scaffold676_cov175-Chaetoceros_neogracile.AAC.1